MNRVRDKASEIAKQTEWVVRNNKIPGPIELVYPDGSELTVVDSPVTSTLHLKYTPAEGTRAFNDDSIRGSQAQIIEFIEHISTRHEEQN